MLRHSSFSYNEALAKFHEQLQRCTLTAYCGREFILITKLKQWLKCDSPIPGKTWLGLLLPTEPTQLEPSVSERMLTHSNALITFCILLNLSRTKYLETFIRVNFVDSKLPIYLSALRSELNDAQIDEAEFLAESFAKEQWKFCPATFELEGTDNYIQNWILPITNYEPINEKGGTADLWQIEVPEDFVGETLRAEVPRSRYKGPDGHEWVSRRRAISLLQANEVVFLKAQTPCLHQSSSTSLRSNVFNLQASSSSITKRLLSQIFESIMVSSDVSQIILTQISIKTAHTTCS